MNNIDIKYNVLGQILEGDNKGWFVKILDDTNDSGGYILYEFEDIEGGNGFDTWLEKEEDVKGYINESKWKINWISNGAG